MKRWAVLAAVAVSLLLGACDLRPETANPPDVANPPEVANPPG